LTEEVIVQRSGGSGCISLNRPRALHALTQAMCETICAALLKWRFDDRVEAVILIMPRGAGSVPAGDVAAVRRSALEDGGYAGRGFFRAEYQMNHLLFTYPKPVVAFMDGVTMGGGVGLALPCRYRIATENTLFAMPEGAIGLFPDVGAGWYLPRLPGRIGAVHGADRGAARRRRVPVGRARHALPASEQLAHAKSVSRRNQQASRRSSTILPLSRPPARLVSNAERIARLFASDRLEDVLSALAADSSDWAAKELQAVASKMPDHRKGRVAPVCHQPRRVSPRKWPSNTGSPRG
jgi:enoyl-CoA hydratase